VLSSFFLSLHFLLPPLLSTPVGAEIKMEKEFARGGKKK